MRTLNCSAVLSSATQGHVAQFLSAVCFAHDRWCYRYQMGACGYRAKSGFLSSCDRLAQANILTMTIMAASVFFVVRG